MAAQRENGRRPEQVRFDVDGTRFVLPATEDDPDDELRALRERIRALQEPIQVREENS
jgi:hypothetical protein